MEKPKIRLLGICGSLRKKSYNRALLAAAAELLPPHASLEIADLSFLPLFSQDDEQSPAEAVRRFKQAVAVADAILFAAPEYNYSFSGVLKNALDWGTRPPGENVWNGKPAAMMGASPGMLGTARAQYHLRQVFVALNMICLNRPEVMVGQCAAKFDENVVLRDAKTREKINELVEALVLSTESLKH